jgi:hypothetical protein
MYREDCADSLADSRVALMSFKRRRKRGSLVRYMARRPHWRSAQVDDGDNDDHSSGGGTEMAAVVEVMGGICTDARALCG